jgi:AAA domain-containing protein
MSEFQVYDLEDSDELDKPEASRENANDPIYNLAVDLRKIIAAMTSSRLSLPSDIAVESSALVQIDATPWWRDPQDIPPRQSLYGRHYIRGAIGATIAAGGRAKTTLAIYEAISMATGRNLKTGEALPCGPLRVSLLNGEENQDELDRRVAAACQCYGITKADLDGRLFVKSVRDYSIRIAKMVRNVPMLDTGVVARLTEFVQDSRLDVVMIDPLISFHGVPENDNGAMDIVIKNGLGAIAAATNSAIEVFHHPGKPKPGQAETTVEDARGASAVIWAVRSARVLNFMMPEEAAKIGIAEDQRRLHIRIANGKANMGPIGKAEWMRLIIENLPNGDQVAVASSWTPPDPFQGITTADMELARELAATGDYRADSRSPMWIGYALAKHLQLDVSHSGHGLSGSQKDGARLKEIIRQWRQNKVLATEERTDNDGKKRSFIVSGSFKPEPRPNVPTDDDYTLQ